MVFPPGDIPPFNGVITATGTHPIHGEILNVEDPDGEEYAVTVGIVMNLETILNRKDKPGVFLYHAHA